MADLFDHLKQTRRQGQHATVPHYSAGVRQGRRSPLLTLLLSLLMTVGLALTPAASLLAAPASQQSYNYSKPAGISVEQAAAMVRRETGGRVLSANPTKSNGQRGYNIRVLVDGKRIKQYYVDDQGRMSPK